MSALQKRPKTLDTGIDCKGRGIYRVVSRKCNIMFTSQVLVAIFRTRLAGIGKHSGNIREVSFGIDDQTETSEVMVKGQAGHFIQQGGNHHEGERITVGKLLIR